MCLGMGDCYICLEECDHKSPCDCAQPVHEKCLHDARQYSRKCTICKEKFDDDLSDSSDSSSEDEVEVYMPKWWILFWCSPLIYVISGFAGQMCLGLLGIVIDYVPIIFTANTWRETLSVIGSFNFFVSAVLVHVPFVVYSLWKNRSN